MDENMQAKYEEKLKEFLSYCKKHKNMIEYHEITDFFAFDNSKALKDIKLEGYEHQGRLPMPVTE